MTKRINSITDEQRAAMHAHVENWIGHGLKTGETDWGLAESTVREIYDLCGLDNVPIFRATSPLAGALIAAILRDSLKMTSDSKQVRNQVWNQVRNQVWNQVSNQVWNQVRYQVWDQVWNQVWDQVCNQVWDQVSNQVWDQGLEWHNWYGGQLWSAWAAHTDFMVDVLGLDLGELKRNERVYVNLAKSCCYIWPNQSFCVVGAHPAAINLNDSGELHHESEMAIQWPDGWGLWMFHGVPVPEKVITSPDSLTLDEIRTEGNLEIKRVMMERYGMGEYLVEIQAKVIDVDTVPIDKLAGIDHITRALIVDDTGAKYLVGTDGSTGRVYHIRAHADSKTCSDAHDRMMPFGKDSEILMQS